MPVQKSPKKAPGAHAAHAGPARAPLEPPTARRGSVNGTNTQKAHLAINI